MLNRYRGQRNHAETIRAVAFGGLLLLAWGATLATLSLVPGGRSVAVIGTGLVEMADVEVAAAAMASETR